MLPHSHLPPRNAVLHIKTFLNRLFDLKKEADIPNMVSAIRSNIAFKRANAWTLAFAIIITSVGLNTNSTAVIIGAMLISPIMGPIIGVGFALGTQDFSLVKNCLKNLSMAVAISLVASYLFFFFSPIYNIRSEILARTQPTFFDVLVAFFGGAAGVVALSQKEKGNVIPGVAIATALLPALCTSGFALAHKNLQFFLGSLYLFLINCVFIVISSYIFISYLNFHDALHLSQRSKSKINKMLTYIGIIVLTPSFFMAWYLQKESLFTSNTNKFITYEFKKNNVVVIDKDISFHLKNPQIKLRLLDDGTNPTFLENAKQNAKKYSLDPQNIDITTTEIKKSIVKGISQSLFTNDAAIKDLQIKVQTLLAQQKEKEIFSSKEAFPTKKINQILKKSFPKLQKIYLVKEGSKTTIYAQWKKIVTRNERVRLKEFLKEKTNPNFECCKHTW